MRIALFGIPKVGKTKYANDLAKEMPADTRIVDRIATKFSKRTDLAVGFPADYRIEMALLVERYLMMEETKEVENLIFTSSYLDSLAYIKFNQSILEEDAFKKESNEEMDRVLSNLHTAFNFLLDGFKFDKVIIFQNENLDALTSLEVALEWHYAYTLSFFREALEEFGVEIEQVSVRRRPPKSKKSE